MNNKFNSPMAMPQVRADPIYFGLVLNYYVCHLKLYCIEALVIFAYKLYTNVITK